MERAAESPATERSAATAPSIPIQHYLAAAKDVELRLLLRKKATAAIRVARALKEETDAEEAIGAYIASVYPAPESA